MHLNSEPCCTARTLAEESSWEFQPLIAGVSSRNLCLGGKWVYHFTCQKYLTSTVGVDINCFGSLSPSLRPPSLFFLSFLYFFFLFFHFSSLLAVSVSEKQEAVL